MEMHVKNTAARLVIISILSLWLPLILGNTTVCDFETDQCGYNQVETEPAQWTRNFGPSWLRSTLGSTGPATDHTEGATTGYYMVLLNIPNLYVYSPGDTARLVSPCYPASRSVDVLFYYHMYGDGIGQLNVFLVDCNYLISTSRLSVISITGDQGDEWKLAGFSQANVPDFKIVFEAIRGLTENSDIAIDDISIERTDPNSNTDPQEYLDEADIACTFESDPCGFQQDQTDDTDMVYHYGSSWLRQLDGSTGPTADHTNGINTNFYMILLNVPDQLDLDPGDTARLLSPCYTIAHWIRVIFYYHMYGEGMGTLNVYSSECDSMSLSRRFFSVSGNQGDEWMEGTHIVYAGEGIQIIFEAIRGPEQTSDIAIDDIAIFALNDDEITTTAPPTTSTTDNPTTTKDTTTKTITTTEALPPTDAHLTTSSSTTKQNTDRLPTDVLIGPCHPNPCLNEGACTDTDDVLTYECSCMNKWTGPNCEEVDSSIGAQSNSDSNTSFAMVNIVIIIIASIAVLLLLCCFIVFGYTRERENESKRKAQEPSYQRARAMQEQLQRTRQIHFPKTDLTYHQRQQRIINDEKERQLQEQLRKQQQEKLPRQTRQLPPNPQGLPHQMSLESTDGDATDIRPPLRKQQSTGRKLPRLPTTQNYV